VAAPSQARLPMLQSSKPEVRGSSLSSCLDHMASVKDHYCSENKSSIINVWV
jgi:hypothetical protein